MWVPIRLCLYMLMCWGRIIFNLTTGSLVITGKWRDITRNISWQLVAFTCSTMFNHVQPYFHVFLVNSELSSCQDIHHQRHFTLVFHINVRCVSKFHPKASEDIGATEKWKIWDAWRPIHSFSSKLYRHDFFDYPKQLEVQGMILMLTVDDRCITSLYSIYIRTIWYICI